LVNDEKGSAKKTGACHTETNVIGRIGARCGIGGHDQWGGDQHGAMKNQFKGPIRRGNNIGISVPFWVREISKTILRPRRETKK